MNVQILSKKLIKPSVPTPSHLKTMKLSLIDQIIPSTYINMVFYYTPNGEDSTTNSKDKCSRLESSLSEVLTVYYPLAGRLVLDDMIVDCNDKGVEFVEAQVSGRLVDFLKSRSNIAFIDQFVAWDINLNDMGSAPLVAIQISVFDCGGLVLGIRVSHKVADSCSVITFINGWAKASKCGVEIVPSPNFDLGSHFPTSKLLPPNPPSTTKNDAKIVTKRFLFDDLTIKLLVERTKIASTMVLGTPIHARVVAAVIWKALIGVAKAKHGQSRDSILVRPINLRGKSSLSISENCFGNLAMLSMKRFNGDYGKVDLLDLVNLLENASKETEIAKISSYNDVCSMVTESFREARKEKLLYDKVDVYLCGSWCELPNFYQVDFGWGNPIWVSSTSKSYEVISLIDDNKDGIEAWVSLNEGDMIGFENDKEIVALTSW